MTKQGTITRKRYASIQLLAGAAVAAVGVLLHGIGPKSIYDLPLYLMMRFVKCYFCLLTQ